MGWDAGRKLSYSARLALNDEGGATNIHLTRRPSPPDKPALAEFFQIPGPIHLVSTTSQQARDDLFSFMFTDHLIAFPFWSK
jgi:hypothetical protein